jgi:hypothetical protein
LYVDIASVGGRCDDSRLVLLVSLRTPWCSLTKALADAPAGSTVYVRGGRYPELVVPSYAPASLVSYEGYDNERPIIAGVQIGSDQTASRNFALRRFKLTAYGMRLVNVSDVSFVGNEIALTPVAPTGCPTACVVRTPTAVVLTPPASNLTFSGNYVHNGNLGIGFRLGRPPLVPGIPLSDTYTNITIENNTFKEMGGVVLSIQNFQGVTVRHNVFASNHTRGNIDPQCHCDSVHAIGGGDGLTLDSNYVYGGRGFLLQPGYADGGNCEPGCRQLTHVTVQNNAIVGPDFGLRVLSAPGIRVVNNTIWGTQVRDDLGVLFYNDFPITSGIVLANNLIRNFQARSGVTFAVEDHNDIAQTTRGPGYVGPAGRQDISATPCFASSSAAPWDFHLLPGSPGIGAASPAFAPATDLEGLARRDPPTIGAYEPVPNLPRRTGGKRKPAEAICHLRQRRSRRP